MQTRIKAIRQETALTQSAFGQRIGLKANTVSQLENGVRSPSKAVILTICREFNINEEWLCAGTGEMHAPPTAEQKQAALIARMGDDPNKLAILRLLDDIPAPLLADFLRYLRQLVTLLPPPDNDAAD